MRNKSNAPIDFTPEMARDYTIIVPDIFPIHMELIAEIFRLHGYKIQVVHYQGKDVIDTGLKYLHNDICYPAICMLGQVLYALQCGDFDPHKSALVQFQTGGGCRASNYLCLLRKALERMGMPYVPVISISLSGYEHYSGFKLTPKIIVQAIRALIYGDMILLLKNQIRPYEKTPGDTLKVKDYWVQKITDQFRCGKGISGKAFKQNLREIARDFDAIETEDRKLKKVGIVGEIYVKYASLGNNDLEEFLLSQGCEYMIPGVLGFFQFMFENMVVEYNYYKKSFVDAVVAKFMIHLTSKWEREIENALRPYPRFKVPCEFEQVKTLASTVIDRGVKMGEGWLLPGESCELIEKGYDNIICVQPFGCLPNHIVGKGTIRRLRELYPSANIFPVDYDAGASKVNQENRIKLMLAIAEDKDREKTDEAGNRHRVNNVKGDIA